MKNLLVTFPVDLGNRTIESNLQEIFRKDMDFFRFAAQHAHELDSGVDYKRNVRDRLLSIYSLRKKVDQYSKSGKYILFNGLSPAFLSYGSWQPEKTAIAFDWTRLLYPDVLGEKLEKNWVFKLHRQTLRRCPKILCWTDAIMKNLMEHYGVSSTQLHKVPAPFLVAKLDIAPRPTPSKPRVLFVGGDMHRKGGDVLVKSFEKELRPKCDLTMLTSNQNSKVDGIKYITGVRYGTAQHRKTYEDHDILVLPTRIDAYPQVLGEAAAAGLAVITTKHALGANEVIKNGESGYIFDTPEECVQGLGGVLNNINLIDSLKHVGYRHMHEMFSEERIRKTYLDILNN